MKSDVVPKPRRKHPDECAVRINISLAPRLADAAVELVRRGGYQGLSDYISARIRKDSGLDIVAQ